MRTEHSQRAGAGALPVTGPAAGRVNRQKPVKVYVSDTDRDALEACAKAAGLSLSSYLLTAGLNRPIRTVADTQAVADLVKVAADLGRLGGLLKLWLADRRGEGAPPFAVDKVLGETRELQQCILKLASQVRQARSQSSSASETTATKKRASTAIRDTNVGSAPTNPQTTRREPRRDQ